MATAAGTWLNERETEVLHDLVEKVHALNGSEGSVLWNQLRTKLRDGAAGTGRAQSPAADA